MSMSLTTGMYGPVKMRDGERIMDLSVFVVQDNHRVVEILKYHTESEILDVYQDVFDSIIWYGNSTRMPASNTVTFRCMYSLYELLSLSSQK